MLNEPEKTPPETIGRRFLRLSAGAPVLGVREGTAFSSVGSGGPSRPVGGRSGGEPRTLYGRDAPPAAWFPGKRPLRTTCDAQCTDEKIIASSC